MSYNSYNDRSYKWSELFASEEELIAALSEIDAEKFRKMTDRFIVKGVDYITVMVRTIKSGKSLSPAQITQLKRLAKQVKIYHEAKHLVRD